MATNNGTWSASAHSPSGAGRAGGSARTGNTQSANGRSRRHHNPPKRGSGRMRKVTIEQPVQQPQEDQAQPAAPAPQATAADQPMGPITRARAPALEHQELSGTTPSKSFDT
jgi:hypothetical protein